MNRDRLLHFQKTVALLNDSLIHLHHQHDVWVAYAKRMRELPADHDFHGEGIFHDWLTRNYADAMAIGIRRVVFPGSGGAACAIELIRRLRDDKEGVTFENAMAIFGPDNSVSLRRHEGWLRKRFFQDGEQVRASLSAMGRDIALLEGEDVLARIKVWADKRVAHFVPAAEVRSVAFDEVESALRVVGDVLRDYSVLLIGSGMSRYTPWIEGHWEGVLDRMFAGPSERS